jgi:hypothetical protein
MKKQYSISYFLLFVFCSHLVGCSSIKHNSYSANGSKKPLSVISKHHQQKILTYFIHKEDTLYQIFNIALNEKNEETILTGFVVETDSNKVEQYYKMLADPKYKTASPEDELNTNQAHVFVSDYQLDKVGRITIDNSAVVRYDLYESSKKKNSNMSLGLKVGIWLVGAGTLVGGVLFLWSKRPTWEN